MVADVPPLASSRVGANSVEELTDLCHAAVAMAGPVVFSLGGGEHSIGWPAGVHVLSGQSASVCMVVAEAQPTTGYASSSAHEGLIIKS